MIKTTSIALIPACYSKAQKIKDFKNLLQLYPQQKCNTPEAFEGKVFELCFSNNGPFGSLPEYYEHLGAITIFIKAKDGILKVDRKTNGDWVAED